MALTSKNLSLAVQNLPHLILTENVFTIQVHNETTSDMHISFEPNKHVDPADEDFMTVKAGESFNYSSPHLTHINLHAKHSSNNNTEWINVFLVIPSTIA